MPKSSVKTSRSGYLQAFDMAAVFFVLEAVHLLVIHMGLFKNTFLDSSIIQVGYSAMLLVLGVHFTLMGILMKRDLARVKAEAKRTSSPNSAD